MSELTNALDRIKTWLTNNCPLLAESITPGLNPQEIQAIIETIPFSLPQEIRELYQWSRGHNEETLTNYAHVFYGMNLCSLDRAIKIFPTFDDEFEECSRKYMRKQLFPIFSLENIFLCVIGDWDEHYSSPIIFVSDINDITHRYVDLTNMMLTLAECFEESVFAFNEDGSWDYDVYKFSPIYIKYNAKILKFSLEKLKQELVMRKDDDVLIDMSINDFEGDISCLNMERTNLKTQQLNIEVLQPLIIATQDENEIVRDLAKKALKKWLFRNSREATYI
jgi:hypothetical protein